MSLTREIKPEVAAAVAELEAYLTGLGYTTTRNLARLSITTPKAPRGPNNTP